MSTVAASRVDVKIAVDAQGNASKVVKQTRDELDNMGRSAQNATAQAGLSFSQMATIASQKLSALGGAVSGINAVLGGTSPELQKIGQGFTAAGAVANILPGPIGLAAAAVTGLSVATYAFVKAADEAEAKTRFMRGGAGSEGLAERVGVTQDAILGMQQSMEELRDKGLAPSEPLLIAVRERAEAMGRDGAKAVGDFVSALSKGPEALRALQATLGDLNVGTIEQLAKQLGLSLETIGAAKNQLDYRQKAKDLETEYAALLAEQAILRKKADDESAAASKRYGSGVVDQLKAAQDAQERFNATQPKQIELEGRIAALKAQAVTIEQAAKAERDQALQSNLVKTRAAQLDVQAGVTKNQNVAVGLKLQAVDERIADIQARQVLLSSQQAGYSALEYRNKEEVLKLELAQAEAAKTQLIEADKAAQKAKREASAAKRKEQLASEVEAVKKLRDEEAKSAEQSSKNAATDSALLAVRLRNLDADTAAERKAAREKANTAAGRAAALKAIDLEYATSRKKLEDDFTKATDEQARFVVDKRKEAFEQELQAEIETQAKIDELSKAQTAKSIEDLRKRGDFHEATLAEIQAAEQQAATNIAKINQELAVKLTGLDEDSALAAKERQLAEARIAAEQQSLAVKTSEAYAKQAVSTNDAIDKQIGTIDKITSSALQAGGLTDIGKGMAGLASNVLKGSAAFDQFNQAAQSGNLDAMAKANEGLSGAIDGTITASGAAAAAFVDDEKTKAGILALTETAASIASFATGNVVGGIGHAASAAIYAGIAGGAIPAGGPGAGGGATAGATTGGGGEIVGTTGNVGGGGAGVTQVFNFNKGFVIGSTQEVAKGISGTLRSVNGTGYDRRKAA